MSEVQRADGPAGRDGTEGGESAADIVLRPMRKPTWKLWVTLALCAVGVVWFLQAWVFQLQEGMIVTGLGDWGTGGGIPWGIYVGSFIWWVGIAHGGIIISAAVRLFGLNKFKPVARLAELLTVAALIIATTYIIIHLGRPDRVFTSIVPNLDITLQTSPLAWDMMVITMYLVLTLTYLFLTLRADIHELRDRLPKRLGPLYKLILIGHRDDENHKVERMAWWLALGVIILAPLFLHGGVIPWLFALLPGQPGWFSAAQGPVFLTAALASALGGVTILAWVFRRLYGWEDILDRDVFLELSRWLGLFALLFLWLQLQKIITGVHMGPLGDRRVTDAMLGEPLYWIALGLIGVGMVHAAVQIIAKSTFSLPRTVIVGAMPLLGVYLEKTLFVMEGLQYPHFSLYDGVPGSYFPSWVELSTLPGVFALVVVMFVLFSRVVPLIELEAVEE